MTASIKDKIRTYLRYSANIDYNESRNCEEAGCDSICRCSKIVGARVTNIDVSGVAENVTGELKRLKVLKSDLDRYCAERIISHGIPIDGGKYEVTICGGYYGQEVDGISPEDISSLDTVQENINHLLDLKTDIDKVHFILKNEYGFILPQLKPYTKVSIKTIDINDIFVGQVEHYRRLNKDTVKMYEHRSPKLPGVLVIEKEGKYTLIDGYHRLAAASKAKKISAVILSI